MSETSRLSIPELDEFKDEHELNDIQSEFYSITNTNNNSNSNSIYKMITFRSNKSLYILMIGILGAIAMIICISLATTTSNSIISDSNRDILSVGATSSNETPTQSLKTESLSEDNEITPEGSVTSDSGSDVNDNEQTSKMKVEQLIQSLLDETTPGSIEDKVLGTLLGSAIGDALGLPLEFYLGKFRLELPDLTNRLVGGESFQIWLDKEHTQKYENADKEYAEKAVELAMQMKGGGFFKAEPGQSSDDTAMAIQMARGFIETGKAGTDAVNIETIRKNNMEQYHKWANPNPTKETFQDGDHEYKIRNRPFDIGETIRDLYMDKKKEGLLDQILEKTKKLNVKSYFNHGSGVWSNGALMRIAPMAVYCLHLEDNDVYKVVDADLSLTNNNPFVTTAVTTYVLMAREMIKGGTVKKAFEKAESFLKARKENDIEDVIYYKLEKPSTVVLKWIDDIRKENKSPKPCDEAPISTIETGFKQGIYWLEDASWRTPTHPDTDEEVQISGPNFAIAMKEILLGKGDTDTNAAIYGVLGGAQLGIHGIYNLPNNQGKEWLEKLLSCSVDPHPRVIDGKTSRLKDEVEADHNPYLATQYINEGIWKRLIEVAPKSITDYEETHLTINVYDDLYMIIQLKEEINTLKKRLKEAQTMIEKPKTQLPLIENPTKIEETKSANADRTTTDNKGQVKQNSRTAKPRSKPETKVVKHPKRWDASPKVDKK